MNERHLDDPAAPLLSVLGAVSLRETAGGTAGVGGPKPQAILARLALEAPAVVSVDRLIDTVWGPHPPSKPEVTLRTYISHLRRALEPTASHLGLASGDLLATRSPGYCLLLPTDEIDLHRFRRLADSALAPAPTADPTEGRDRCRRALEVWPTGQLGDSPLAALTAEAADLRELRSALIERSARHDLVEGRPADALGDLRSVIAAEPLREEPRRLLILALYRAGRTAEALRAHEAARKDLAEALGLELSPTLRDLERMILDHDPALLTADPAPIAPRSAVGDAAPTAGPTRARVIGRDDELEVGYRHIDRVLDGHGSLLVLTGEPGIGKTTLATAFADRAATRARVAWGRCHDGGESTTLWPWTRALRNLLHDLDDDDLARVLGPQRPEIAGLVPDLGRRLDTEPSIARDDRTLGDAIAAVIRRLAADRPVVIVLDDLHWADQPSVEVLATISPSLLDAPVGIVATWRSTEEVDESIVGRLHEVGRLAAEGRVDLTGLDHDAVAHLVAEQGLATLDADDIDRLLGRTAGNPLFLRELLRQPGDRATATVREAIDRRLDHLGDDVGALLSMAALSRRPLPPSVLAAALHLDGATVDGLIDRAVAGGVLENVRVLAAHDEETRLAFTHSLIAERLTERLPSNQRPSHHASLARALESADATAESLAFHYRQGAAAGTAAKGAHWSWRAARNAMALHDHTTAERLLRQAESVLPADGPVTLRVDLLLDLAQVAKFHARYADAHELSSQAFDLATTAGDLDRMCLAALVFAGQVRAETNRYGTQWLGYWNPAAPSVAMLETCLARLDPGEARHASIAIALAAQLFGTEADPDRGRALSVAALEVARDRGDDILLTEGLFTFHTALQRSLTAEERAGILDELDTAATRAGLVERRLDACRARYLGALERLDRSGADRQIARAGQLATASDDYLIGVQHRSMEISDLLLRGEIAEASAQIHASFEEFAPIGFTSLEVFGIQFAASLQELGELDQVIDLLEERSIGYPGPAYGLPLAAVLVDAGRFEEAANRYAGFDPAEVASGGEGVLQFSSLSFAADVLAEVGAEADAAMVFDALAPARRRMVAMFDGLVVRGLGSLPLGRLATRLGRHAEARELLLESLHGHRKIKAAPFELRTLLALAALDGTDSESASQARDLGEQLGMGWLVRRRMGVEPGRQ